MSAVAAQPSPTGPLWHPFADMGAVEGSRFVLERAEGVWIWDEPDAATWMPRPGSGTRTSATGVPRSPRR